MLFVPLGYADDDFVAADDLTIYKEHKPIHVLQLLVKYTRSFSLNLFPGIATELMFIKTVGFYSFHLQRVYRYRLLL